MKALFVHAHFDDYEFTTAGLFERWRSERGADFTGKVLICTDGAAGHHFRTREETARVRWEEQLASAKLGQYQVERLQLPDGRFGREACLQLDIPFMAALWKAIRDFQPDYLFCPPPPADALAGIHVDHEAVSAAVRRVAYMINVPHAFTPEYPADETQSQPCKVPVILHVYDTYMSGTNRFDLAVDVESAFDLISKMSWCHQSQIREWLPWVGRHDMRPPEDLADWGHVLRRRFRRRNQEVDLDAKTTYEVFTVTAWGQVPKYEDIVRDFPVSKRFSHLSQLNAKLQKWKA